MERAASLLSRRRVVIGLAGGVVAAMVATPLLRPSAEPRVRRLLASNALTRRFLSLAHAEQGEWTAQVGSHFSVDGGYRLRLAGVRPLQSSGARPDHVSRDRAFVAVFDVLGGMTMAGDLIYSVAHPQYGRLPLYLTTSDNPRRMLAVFN